MEVLVDQEAVLSWSAGAEARRSWEIWAAVSPSSGQVRATRAAQAWRLTTSVSSVERRSSSSRVCSVASQLAVRWIASRAVEAVVAGRPSSSGLLTVDGHVDQHRQLGDTADRLGHPEPGRRRLVHSPRRIASTRWAWLACGYSLPTRTSGASPAWPLLPGAGR